MSQGSRVAVVAVALAVLAGCAGPSQGGSSGVTVERWGEAPPKPPGCQPEILEKAPLRPYTALGELKSHLTNPPPQGAVSVLLPKACELGADAVIVQRNNVLNAFGHVLVDVIAIRWAPEPPAAEPAAATTVAPAAPAPVEPAAAATTAPVALPPVQSVPQTGAGPLNPREPKR